MRFRRSYTMSVHMIQILVGYIDKRKKVYTEPPMKMDPVSLTAAREPLRTCWRQKASKQIRGSHQLSQSP